MAILTDSSEIRTELHSEDYQHEDTRALAQLVHDAADLIRLRGEAAFDEFRLSGSRWRKGESYIFVLDLQGNMLVHPDPDVEGANQRDLTDVNGKPIIRGLIAAAATHPNKSEGWYHYEWPVPGGLLPRWKSTFVVLVPSPSGSSYIVGSGIYNDRMERAFVLDIVKDAAAEVETHGANAFPLFHDAKGPFIVKDAYIFVIDADGVDLVNPAFPNLEGRNVLDVKDARGKMLIREMFEMVERDGSGWVDYMWPRPGESVSTEKSAFVSKAKMGEQWVLVGCGVYLADAPKAPDSGRKLTASQLMALVNEAAAVLEERGDQGYAAFRERGSKWFRDDTYLFVWSMEGIRTFHAADPAGEGQDVSSMKDIIGRPIGKMILDVAASPEGEGWIHYMYPEPGDIFPTWKSTFVKRVNFPSGIPHIVGCGIYNMQMDRVFIEDMVNRAAALIEERGKEAFTQLRDRTGAFVFMDTYVFVDTPDGTELVNPGQPSLEGRNLIELRDIDGKAVVQEEIAAAMRDGSAWLALSWFKPGTNRPARKETFVKRVRSRDQTFIVGSGVYTE